MCFCIYKNLHLALRGRRPIPLFDLLITGTQKTKTMRPRLDEKDARTEMLLIRLSREEKLRLRALAKRGKYPCMSDFLRSRVFEEAERKQLSLDAETTERLKSLDYELNRIGVNLNQLSKRMNSFAGYRMDDSDRKLLKQAFDQMRDCLILLQKHLR